MAFKQRSQGSSFKQMGSSPATQRRKKSKAEKQEDREIKRQEDYQDSLPLSASMTTPDHVIKEGIEKMGNDDLVNSVKRSVKKVSKAGIDMSDYIGFGSNRPAVTDTVYYGGIELRDRLKKGKIK